MKVLMLSWEYPPHSVGGLGKHVLELVPALARLGVDVHLITHGGSGGAIHEVIGENGEQSPGEGRVHIHRAASVATTGSDFFPSARQMNESIESVGHKVWDEYGPFDLIHAHDWLVGFAAVSLKHQHRSALLTTIHATEYGRCRGALGNEMSRAINHTEWWLTYESWRVICCSQYMADEVKLALKTPSDKLDVIPNGVDPARFDVLTGEDLSDFRASFAGPNQEIVFYVGRVVYEKGVQVLVQAMARILAQRPGIKLVVAGTGDSLNAVRQLAIDLGIGDHCYFTGFIPDGVRDRLFRVSNVAAFPSLYEPFGIVALEAMAAHLPVVASAVGGLREVLRHAENSITVYPNDANSLAWGILHTLNEPEWAKQRADNAYRMVVDEYGWDRIARLTLDEYARVVDERLGTTWD
ncbi:MAG TPA: glycosyltransferase family 4 protein [Chloroflexota bacterium]|nr:glycosyltransferase family 4 protein [Chloroflexota bacterium]